MKSLIISRILFLLHCNGGGTPSESIAWTNTRWVCIAMELGRMIGLDPASKEFRKSLNTGEFLPDLETLTDGQLVEIYEMVVRRANKSM